MVEKKRIFILDDDKVTLDCFKQLLIKDGFDVDALSSSKDALEDLKAFGPDLIIMDLFMPCLSGLEMCQMLNDDKDTKSIPIIVVSGLCDEADIKKAYILGVVSYITKPCDYEKLLREIKKAIYFKEDKTN